MRVDHNTYGNFESDAENHIRRLATYAGKRAQFVHFTRHLTIVFVDELLSAGFDVLRFVLKKTCGANQLFDLLNGCFRHGFGVGKLGKQMGRDQIDPLVGTLSRQDRGHKKLKRIFVIESTLGVSVMVLKTRERPTDFERLFGSLG